MRETPFNLLAVAFTSSKCHVKVVEMRTGSNETRKLVIAEKLLNEFGLHEKD